VLENRSDATVPARPSAAAKTQAPEGQIQIIVDDHERPRVEAGEGEDAADGLAAAVHEGLRQCEQTATSPKGPVADDGPVPLLPQPDAVRGGEGADQEEPGVVAGALVPRTGVPESDDDGVEGGYFFSSAAGLRSRMTSGSAVSAAAGAAAVSACRAATAATV
jgi:hypothetical protein